MQIIEDRYLVTERKLVDGVMTLVEVQDAVVLTPETAYGTAALMTLARCWEASEPALAAQIRGIAAEWAPVPVL